jgi:prolyl-tRNA editing enzyme YbaK/EbsC (Cys-tRNA(Pro) deacylase)
MHETLRTPHDLQRFIATHGITAQLLREVGDTPTVPAAAAVLGVETDQIIKTLLFVVEWPETPSTKPTAVVVISHGERRVDRKQLAAHLGVSHHRIRFASAGVVLELLGYPAGGVPPLGHKTALPVILDAAVVHAAAQVNDIFFGGGGDDRTMLRISLTELIRVVQPEVVAVS